MENIKALFDKLTFEFVKDALLGKEFDNARLACARKETPAVGEISRADHAVFAKALSGFANTGGGILFWGVAASKGSKLGMDLVQGIAPIKMPESFERGLRALETDAVERPVPGLEYKALETGPGEGLLAIFVPQSTRAPHRSLLDKEFYIRAEGTFAALDLKAVEYFFARRSIPELRFSVTLANGRATVADAGTATQARAETAPVKSVGEAPLEPKENEARQPRPRVVAIDDNVTMLDLVREGLEPDYEVHCAAQASDGLRLIENMEPSIVILDIEMPGIDGFVICEAIRETGWVRHVPVLFLTGHAGSAFEAEARKAGGDAFLTKPFSIPDLIATVDKLCGRPNKSQK